MNEDSVRYIYDNRGYEQLKKIIERSDVIISHDNLTELVVNNIHNEQFICDIMQNNVY